MTIRQAVLRIFLQEDINFLLTNRIPRRLATRFMGWFSRIEQPVVRRLSLGAWKLFADLRLHEAKHTRFRSLHDCFIRELRDGARPFDADPALLCSPCDAIVGACGRIEGQTVLQAKGFAYKLHDLLADPQLEDEHRDGTYVTLRITASMYHRFHAPSDCLVEQVTYISGDTWNVNPIALKRIERLFCRNERAVIRTRLAPSGVVVTLVPVAAILVASIRLRCIEGPLDLRYAGPNVIPCNTSVRKGEEMGWFEHGSTIIVFVPPGFELVPGIRDGMRIRAGEGLLRRV
jgi:phosphatidylserine decarboxylase